MRRFIGAKPVLGWAKRQGKLLAGLAAGLIVGGSAIAFAAIPDAGGAIHACYRTSNGSLRVIDDATTTCASNETAITWNQTGPQGPAGATGPQGPVGPQGPAGNGNILVSNLVGADFSDIDLAYHNLNGLDMHNSIFRNTANFRGSSFSGANLSGVLMQYPGIFADADFSGANFSNAHVHGDGTTFADANFQDTNFTNGLIQSLSIKNPGNYVFGPADFRGSTITGAVLHGHFIQVNFSGVDFRQSTLLQEADGYTSTGFKQSDFSGANLSGLPLEYVRFIESNMSGADFTNTQFLGSTFLGSDLSTAILTGATWSNTVCPDGTNSDTNGNTCIGHLVP